MIVVDGLLQAAPVRLAASLLVVDAEAPWGSGRCPPLGDLRAERGRLLKACDGVVTLHRAATGAGASGEVPNPQNPERRLDSALGEVAGAPCHVSGALPEVELASLRAQPSHTSARLPKHEVTFLRELTHVTRAQPVDGQGNCQGLAWLRGQRVHVALAIARPARVLSQLEALGVVPERVWLGPDHGGLDALLRQEKFSDGVVWLTTHKCWSATQTAPHGGPWWLLEERLAVTDTWLDWLRARLV